MMLQGKNYMQCVNFPAFYSPVAVNIMTKILQSDVLIFFRRMLEISEMPQCMRCHQVSQGTFSCFYGPHFDVIILRKDLFTDLAFKNKNHIKLEKEFIQASSEKEQIGSIPRQLFRN